MLTYEVKDLALAFQGRKNIAYAESSMAALLGIRKRFLEEQLFNGYTIGMALHITKESAALVKTLKAGGARVAIASCNPESTQDDVAAALAEEGINVFGKKGETKEEYYQYLENVLHFNPQLTVDDGCDLVFLLHQKFERKLRNMVGGTEETTTGVNRLRAMEKEGALKYPIVAVNNNKTKHLMDNHYGTGQSSLDGILRASNMLIAGKTAVVAGYGPCGKGIAKNLKGLGAKVIVTEVQPIQALEACYDGYQVLPMLEAASRGNLFITVTGNKKIITEQHFKEMKPNALLANAGHFDHEIDMDYLEKHARKEKIRDSLDKYLLDDKPIFVAGKGRLVNLAAAEGHPSEIMSLSFCGQALALEYLVKNKPKEAKVLDLSKHLDNEIARLQLKALNVNLDTLTEEQMTYQSSWRQGT